jgi:nitroreductase
MNPVQKAILDRRSTRGFDETPLTQAQLKQLIDAALASPSAMNRQPWHFAFVTDRTILAEFNIAFREMAMKNATEDMRERFADPAYDLFFGAPLFVAITSDPDQAHAYTGVDCGIAAQNLALSAMGMGLGSVILGMPRDVFASDKGAYYKEKMGIPAGNAYTVGIVIGNANTTKDAHPIFENRYTVI